MLRSTHIAAAAAVLCGSSFARQTLDAGELYPITAPPKDAGVFNLNTQRWMSPSRAAAAQGVTQVIYDNTCRFSGSLYYTGTGFCETYIDEGEIPGPDNLAFSASGGLGATATNNVVLMQFSYCTNFASPSLTIGFYDTLGGRCGGNAPATGNGQPSLGSQACPAGLAANGSNPQGTAYYDLSGTLPGDASAGGTGVACWIVGVFLGNSGFCIQSEGEGTWNNVIDADRFNWSWEMNDVIVPGTAQSGIVITGDPAVGAFGSCTYNLPCAGGCGTGRGTDDGFWINIDGDGALASTNSGVTCVSAPPVGTNCYWFAGYPGNPYASFWMMMLADGSCDGVVPAVNTSCQALPTITQGCDSTVTTLGLPSAVSPSQFLVTFGQLNAQANGTVLYGISGPASTVWSAESVLCVKSPSQTLHGIAGASGNTGGSIGLCNGSYAVDFNAVIRGAYPGLLGTPMSAGATVDVQGWQRDALSQKTTNLTDSVSFTVGP